MNSSSTRVQIENSNRTLSIYCVERCGDSSHPSRNSHSGAVLKLGLFVHSGGVGIPFECGGSFTSLVLSSFTSEREDPVETDRRRMRELLVGLGEVDLVGIEELAGGRPEVTIRGRGSRPCEVCGARATSW